MGKPKVWFVKSKTPNSQYNWKLGLSLWFKVKEGFPGREPPYAGARSSYPLFRGASDEVFEVVMLPGVPAEVTATSLVGYNPSHKFWAWVRGSRTWRRWQLISSGSAGFLARPLNDSARVLYSEAALLASP